MTSGGTETLGEEPRVPRVVRIPGVRRGTSGGGNMGPRLGGAALKPGPAPQDGPRIGPPTLEAVPGANDDRHEGAMDATEPGRDLITPQAPGCSPNDWGRYVSSECRKASKPTNIVKRNTIMTEKKSMVQGEDCPLLVLVLVSIADPKDEIKDKFEAIIRFKTASLIRDAILFKEDASDKGLSDAACKWLSEIVFSANCIDPLWRDCCRWLD